MAATLATVADVLRQLNVDPTTVDTATTTSIQTTLDTADSYIKKIIRWDPSAGGSLVAVTGTQKYFDVTETDTLMLPYDGSTIVQIRTYYGVDSLGTILPSTLPSGSGYEVDPLGTYVRLRPVLLTSPFADVSASRMLMRYDRVEIDYSYTPSGVPTPIRDGVAILAAGMWKSNPRLAIGVTGERIGDYSYSTRQLQRSAPGEGGAPVSGPADYWVEALMLTRPYIKRRPLVV